MGACPQAIGPVPSRGLHSVHGILTAMKIHTRAFLLSCLLSLLLSQPALGEEQMTPANAAPLKSWLPRTPPTGVIIALHSFGDYSAAFDLIGPWFAEKGYAVYAWDQHLSLIHISEPTRPY